MYKDAVLCPALACYQ